ncbi:MAG: hypothetical protein WB392_06180 [Methanotrichaceae archaeon]
MRTLKPYLMLIVVVIVVCIYGVQGQYSMPSIPGSSTHISAPVSTLIEGMIPTSANNAVPSLWIQGNGGWTQYATIPQGSTVTLISVSPSGGNGYLSDTLNRTTTSNYSFYFYPHSQLTFYGDAIGQHILSYTLNGQSSNQVSINVTAYMPPKYRQIPYNYQTLYNYHYYPQSYYYTGPNYPSYGYGRYWSRFYGYGWNASSYPWLNAP